MIEDVAGWLAGVRVGRRDGSLDCYTHIGLVLYSQSVSPADLSFDPASGILYVNGNEMPWNLQMVDVRDIADFVATVIEGDLSGTFNLSGPRIRWRDFVEALDLGQPRWAPVPSPDFRSTPLYRPAGTPRAALMDISSARAQSSGFRPRPAQETVRAAARPTQTP